MVIGNVSLENNVFLAPMAGFASLPFRLICREFGAGLAYSEMVSAKALSYNDAKTKMLLRHDGEKPFAAQIFGHESAVMAEAARYIEDCGADIIDINMGCPTPKIVGNGDGCALMKDTALCGEIINAAARAVSVPVTVKIRIGWDKPNAVEIAKIARESGAAAVTVHGRTRRQQYSGKADWDVIADVVRAVSIPVIGNGDVTCAEDYRNIVETTGCAGVMIGRGALGNPWIFSEILRGTEPPSVSERVSVALRHIRMLIEHNGEHNGILEARGHMSRYLKGVENTAKTRQLLNMAKCYDEIENIFMNLMEDL